MNCKHCNSCIKSFGAARKNGKNHPDWETREYHKKCWKKIQEDLFLKYFDLKIK